MNNLSLILQQRQELKNELARIRRLSIEASERRDFREVARLTLEAAKINKAILETRSEEDLARSGA